MDALDRHRLVELAVGETSVILAAPPSTFGRCFNRDLEGVSSQ